MKKIIYLSLLIWILINSIKANLSEINLSKLKKFLLRKDTYIIDTRDNTISSKGYIQNSLILPLTMDFAKWLPLLVNKGSKIVLICDMNNYKPAETKISEIAGYIYEGYSIYDNIIRQGEINIQSAIYNENTKNDVEKLVKDEKYIVDIREIEEYKETGVIKEANLIPLSTFKENYKKLPKNKDIYAFCKSGGRALLAMSYARRLGYRNKFYIMRGGMKKTIEEGYILAPYSDYYISNLYEFKEINKSKYYQK